MFLSKVRWDLDDDDDDDDDDPNIIIIVVVVARYSPDLNLTYLAAFLRFFAERSESLRSAKNVKKEQEVSDLNPDYARYGIHEQFRISYRGDCQ